MTAARRLTLPTVSFVVRDFCGTRTGVLFHQAYAEILCQACVTADLEWDERHPVAPTRASTRPQGSSPVREGIHRCRCGAWVYAGRPCFSCAAISARGPQAIAS